MNHLDHSSRTEAIYETSLQDVRTHPRQVNARIPAPLLSQSKGAWVQPRVSPIFLDDVVEFRENLWKENKVEETGYQGTFHVNGFINSTWGAAGLADRVFIYS